MNYFAFLCTKMYKNIEIFYQLKPVYILSLLGVCHRYQFDYNKMYIFYVLAEFCEPQYEIAVTNFAAKVE